MGPSTGPTAEVAAPPTPFSVELAGLAGLEGSAGRSDLEASGASELGGGGESAGSTGAISSSLI